MSPSQGAPDLKSEWVEIAGDTVSLNRLNKIFLSNDMTVRCTILNKADVV